MAGTKQRWKRNPDRWRLRADIGRDGDGNRRRLTRVIEAPWTREAERDIVDPALARLVIDAALLRGDPGALADVSVSELIDRFLDHRQGRVRYETLAFYRRHLEVARPHIGHLPATRVRPETLDELYRTLARETRREGRHTVRVHSDLKIAKVHRSLKALFNRALRVWQIIDANPAWGAEPPTVARTEITIPDDDQLADALERLRELDRMMWAFAAVCRWTGARRQAVCGLTRDRVDLGDPTASPRVGAVELSRAVHRGVYGAWTLGPTKTGAQHVIAIGPRAVALVADHVAWLDDQADTLGIRPGPWLFPLDPTDPDRLPNPDTWSKRWARHRDTIGLPGVNLHHLRHYSVARLYGGGFDSVTIAGRHSHSTPSVTERTYAKFLPPRDVAAALYLEGL